MGYCTKFALDVFSSDMAHAKDDEFLDILDSAKTCIGITKTSIYKDEYIANLMKCATKVAAVERLIDNSIYEILKSYCDGSEVKWYSHETDMRVISKAFPQFTFALSGCGEENSDIWIKWFNNGKVQGGRAEIKYPTFKQSDWKDALDF
jgi:hypothetical protein